MMHLGLTTANYTLVADFDLYLTHERLGKGHVHTPFPLNGMSSTVKNHQVSRYSVDPAFHR